MTVLIFCSMIILAISIALYNSFNTEGFPKSVATALLSLLVMVIIVLIFMVSFNFHLVCYLKTNILLLIRCVKNCVNQIHQVFSLLKQVDRILLKNAAMRRLSLVVIVATATLIVVSTKIVH